MIDISKISGENISIYSGIYMHIDWRFGVDPTDATKEQQKKIRKWISGQYSGLILRLPEDENIFSLNYTDNEVFLMLKQCYELENKLAKEKEDKFEKDFSEFDNITREALRSVLNLEVWPQIKYDGYDINFVVDETSAFRRIIKLKNVDAVPKDKQGFYCHDLGMVLKKEQNKYCFYGQLEDPVEDVAIPFGLIFEDAEVEMEIFNSCNDMTYWDNPWDFLRSISFSIGVKADLSGDYCNSKEKELLPLIREIVSLEYWMEQPRQDYLSFYELKALVNKYEHKNAEALLTKMEKTKIGDKDFRNNSKKLIDYLCQLKCEPLWREIYNRITESQEGYPNKVEVLCNSKLLSDVRNNIQSLMESKGYIGTYPDYVKNGVMNGVHLEQSYDMTYFIGLEKNVEYHIHCYESYGEDEYLTVQFVAGTAFLKKGEEGTDIFGCLFNAKGRRLFRTVHHNYPFNEGENTYKDDLETSVGIAIKKAECIKLDKNEQKQYYGNMLVGWKLFLAYLLVAGGLFGIAMTLIAILFSAVSLAVFGLASDIPEFIKSVPWGWVLAFTWIGFGGAMGVVEVLARRK